jgi:hypothetical protein
VRRMSAGSVLTLTHSPTPAQCTYVRRQAGTGRACRSRPCHFCRHDPRSVSGGPFWPRPADTEQQALAAYRPLALSLRSTEGNNKHIVRGAPNFSRSFVRTLEQNGQEDRQLRHGDLRSAFVQKARRVTSVSQRRLGLIGRRLARLIYIHVDVDRARPRACGACAGRRSTTAEQSD